MATVHAVNFGKDAVITIIPFHPFWQYRVWQLHYNNVLYYWYLFSEHPPLLQLSRESIDEEALSTR